MFWTMNLLAGKLILVDEDDVYDEAGSRSPMLLV